MKTRKNAWVPSTLPASSGAPSHPSITVSVTPIAICASWVPISGTASTIVAATWDSHDCDAAGATEGEGDACMIPPEAGALRPEAPESPEAA